MLNIQADELREGDFIPGLGDAYVVEVETETNGYLSYPQTSCGMSAAMPDDTVLVTFHDADGNENYMLLSPTCRLEVQR